MTALQDASWQRMAALRPMLQPHAQLQQQGQRGCAEYVLQDGSSGGCYRLSEPAYRCIALMNGQRTLAEIAALLEAQLQAQAPQWDELLQLLERLHRSGLLISGLPLDHTAAIERQRPWWHRYRNPLAIRIPLLDPDRFLSRWCRWVRPLYGPIGLALWGAVVLPALLLAWLHWPELTHNRVDQLLGMQNLLLLWLVWPLLKVVHELGHAFAVKTLGGEVHEMGIVLMVLVPVPYVNASAASAFAQRRHRVLVGMAGILADLWLAALALLVWLQVEPGRVSALAFSLMLLGSFSTLAFNGNPLLRFDAYYVLCDLIGMPNLGGRANRYIGYLYLRYLVGERALRSPAGDRREAAWLLGYGVAAYGYRWLIMGLITLWVAEYSLLLGGVLAAWLGFNMLLMPLARGLLFLCLSPRLQAQRLRGCGVTLLLALAAGALLGLLPVPCSSAAEGIVWLPQQAYIRAGTEGWVTRLVVAPGSQVEAGQLLLESEAPELSSRMRLLQAQLQELQARFQAVERSNPALAARLQESIAPVQAERRQLAAQLARLHLYSPQAGRFVLATPHSPEGRLLAQGDLIGYLIAPGQNLIRVVIDQDQIGLVRQQTIAVGVQLLHRPAEILPARINRIQPAATSRLPSPALSALAGGQVAIDPLDADGTLALENLFLVEVALTDTAALQLFGGRARVRFVHPSQPLLQQGLRRFRQLFLKRLNY